MGAYYDLYDAVFAKHSSRSTNILKRQLKQLIERDPDYLDPYLLLCDLFRDEDNLLEAERTLNAAYERALNLITDTNGNWPDVLEWVWLENRHIIRTILRKAVALWISEKTGSALDLLRQLLKTNPGDNVGARNYILAIRMGMRFDEFETRFNKGGYYDSDMVNWFEANYKKFPDEFEWWDKETEQYT
ncbi:MAG TPA: tetratricopeptide repeat protein [Methanomicrobia archaeon]|nr:tetratricopeptide repeat protein [Methanomicrobia archaeon]